MSPRGLLLLFVIATLATGVGAQTPFAERIQSMKSLPGFFDLHWDGKDGKLFLALKKFDEPFLYVDALRSGLGSNPVGLDRSQLGKSRVCSWRRFGPKVLLFEHNLGFRSTSGDPAERRAVEESFPPSVLFGAKVEASDATRVLIDITPLLLRDLHGVLPTLARSGEGQFRIDAERSVVDPEALRSFPHNVEMEAVLTLVGEGKGKELRSVAAESRWPSFRLHHSFVKLPDDGYRPRAFHPRSGYFARSFADYSAPLNARMTRSFITRHRLEKKDPEAAVSEPVEAIVYHLDPGVPEPVRTALLEGARWWSQAFEAAGFRNAFRVTMLPEGADPLDVRYNVIQWVHRATRGWSYGSSVVDPRTGEILKGHVLLGSLRVRQDRLLFEGLGLRQACGCGSDAGPCATTLASLDPKTSPIDVALARIRQLAAHEVGHTLGLAHNFAASQKERASVMDYPAPRVALGKDESLDLSKAYGVGIGAWDRLAIRYGYQSFPEAEEAKGLAAILAEAEAAQLPFLSDADARPASASHPDANLWDDGPSAAQSLETAIEVRRRGLLNFGPQALPEGAPLSALSAHFTPLWLHHRYAVEAAAKALGGVRYRHALRGEKGGLGPVPPQEQLRCLRLLLRTLRPRFLSVDPRLFSLLVPPAPGSAASREELRGSIGRHFDPLGAAEVAAGITLDALLQPERLARMELQEALHGGPGFQTLLDGIREAVFDVEHPQGLPASVQRRIERQVIDRLMALAMDARVTPEVEARVLAALESWMDDRRRKSRRGEPHDVALRRRIRRFFTRRFEGAPKPKLKTPPGSPIGR